MTDILNKLTIKGYKSINALEDFELKKLNVLIGGNGAGKSNFIGFFRLLRAIIEGNLNRYVLDSGGIGDLLFNGRKITDKMTFETRFGPRGYRFNLEPGPQDNALLTGEARYSENGPSGWWKLGDSLDGSSHLVGEAKSSNKDSEYSLPVYSTILSWQIYHFHDTSSTAPMRHYEIVQDNKVLRFNASNIAPYLLRLRDDKPEYYREIVNSIRLVMPFFDDFVLGIRDFGEKQKVNLSWSQKGSDYPMQPYHLSDGSIRFICLVTALLQPEPPATIIIDEPELGLHPSAIAILSEVIQSASERAQIIVATQSPSLIDHFNVDDIVVVNRENGASTFKRLEEENLRKWLEVYSLGELWTKNVIYGGPVHE